MEQQFSHDVFISFSFRDQSTVDKIVNHLTNLYNISCWICTESIRAGENFRKDIAKAISEAQLVVLVQSKTSATSNEVSKEILFALKRGKMVKPFIIEDSQLSDELELELSTTHYIDATKPELDDRIRELAKDICQSLGRPFEQQEANAAKRETLLSTPSVIPKKVFCGRENVLRDINDTFNSGERLLFLYGIGGIGKTQIAKQYAKQYKDNYDVIVYATYDGSLKNMLIADAPFSLEPNMRRYTLSDGTTEDDDAYFGRKLDTIKRISDQRTLIIIDNFDVDDDPCLSEFMDGKYHLLITTRCDYSRYFPTVKIDPIESIEALKKIFFENYDGYDVDEDDPALTALIELVNRHTYTIELLALHMENSGQSAPEMIEALKSEGISSINERVMNAEMKTQVAYENLLKMFRLFSLNEEEQQVLMYLSLMPLEGVDLREFRGWADLTSNKLVRDLEKKSWIVNNTEGIALHPIIREVIKHEIPTNEDNCRTFIQRFTESIREKNTWHLPKIEKDRYAGITRCVLAGFPTINADTESLYRSAESLFSFAVDPLYAADLAERLWEYARVTYGEIHYTTGHAAFKRGWLYSYNSQLPDALKHACRWLTKANEIFEQVPLQTMDEIGSFVQNKDNLAKIHITMYEQGRNDADLTIARQYAESALQFAVDSLEKSHHQYSKVAGAHWQLADVLCVSGYYDEALTHINTAIEILVERYTENDSDSLFALYRKAVILHALGDTAQAKELARKSAIGYAEFFGLSHPNVYKIHLLWGDCCAALGEYADAETVYKKTAEIARTVFAPDAQQIADIDSRICTTTAMKPELP